MNNKNVQLINQNVYIIQFIYIMNSFINKLLEKKIEKNYHLNKTLIFRSLHDNIFMHIKNILKNKKYKFKIKNNKTTTKKLKEAITDLTIKIGCLLKIKIRIVDDRSFTRIKKRISTNKFNKRTKIDNG